MILLLFLLGGFVVVGATDTTTVNDRTQADNDAQQRVPPQDMHWSRWSVRKPNKKEQQKAAWREARCRKSAGLRDWRDVTRPGRGKKAPGSKEQITARNKFGLKPPFVRAREILVSLYEQCYNGNESIQSVLDFEVRAILEYETKRLKDPTYKVAYLLDVLMNMGPAFSGISKEVFQGKSKAEVKAAELQMTVTVNHITKTLVANKPVVDKLGTELTIRPYMKQKRKAISLALFGPLYDNGKSALRRRVQKEVEDSFDSTTYDSIRAEFTAEALTGEASDKLREWSEDMRKNAKKAYQVIPESLSNLVFDFHLEGNVVLASKSAPDEDKLEMIEKVDKIESDFIAAYIKHKQEAMPNREDMLNTAIEEAFEQRKREVSEKFHSWEISVVRKSDSKIDVTLLWHLSHMSQYKSNKKSVVKNDHSGARYLLGPSNFVKMPDDLRNGFVSALNNASSGYASRTLMGDAVSYNMIKTASPGISEWLFNVRKNAGKDEVKKARTARNVLYRDLYTMINIGLGRDPNQSPHLVMGLWTDPKLVKSNGKMEAPVLKSYKRPQRQQSNNTSRNQPGPATANNQRKVAEAAAKAKAAKPPAEATPDEVRDFMESQAPVVSTIEAPDFTGWTNAQLKDSCRAMHLKVSGNKAELVERLNAEYARLNEYEQQRQRTASVDINQVRQKVANGESLSPEEVESLLNKGGVENVGAVEPSKKPRKRKRKKGAGNKLPNAAAKRNPHKDTN